MIALEQLEETGLRSSRALYTAEGHRGDPMLHVGKIQHEILHPERRTFADRGRLRRLQVWVTELRLGAPPTCEGAQHAPKAETAAARERQAAAAHDRMRV